MKSEADVNLELQPDPQLGESKAIIWMVAIAALILFLCSSLKHGLFQSTAWDLGIFDQAVYLIAQGEAPISSFTEFHILGDHAAFILYPIALLYKVFADVHWLLAIQSIALSLGALPTYYLAQQAGLKTSQSLTLAAVYLLYPLVFNLNLFDFHPEVIALPAIFAAVLFARLERVGWFICSLVIILSCKAALALTVISIGLWLVLFEKRRLCGSIAISVGIAWFLIATQVIIPTIGGEGASVGRHITRYNYLGNSFSEIASNSIFNPVLWLGKIFSVGTLEYAALALSPIIWRLSPRHLTPLIPAIPALAMNILSSDGAQRDVIHQYSLPVLPFLILVVISSLADNHGWLRSNRAIILWALLGFLILSRSHFFLGRYWESLDTWQATREAIEQVQTDKGSVLTTAEIAPHLTHRALVKLAITEPPPTDLTRFQHILLNVKHPGWLSNPEFAQGLVDRLKTTPQFRLSYQKDRVYLFDRV